MTISSQSSMRLGALLGALLLTAVSPAHADKAKSDKFLKNGMERLANQDLNGAAIQFRNALQQNPNNLPARLQLGRLMLITRNFATAEKEIAWVLERQPTDEIRILHARALLGMSKFEEALEALPERQSALNTSPSEIFLRGAILGGMERHEEALNTIEPLLLADTPLLLQTLYLAANITLKQQNYTQSNAYLDRILEQDPESALAMIQKAQIAVYANDYGRALELLNNAYKIEPNSAPLEFLRIEALIRIGDIPMAEERLAVAKSKFGKVGQHQPRLIYLSSMLATVKQDYKAADNLLIQVSENIRNYHAGSLLQGLVKFQTGQYAQAADAFKRYLRTDQDNEEITLLLGTAYMLSGNARSAIETVEPLAHKDEPSTAALRLLARANVQSSRYNTAITIYEELARRGETQAGMEARAILGLLGTPLGRDTSSGSTDVPRDKVLQAIDKLRSGQTDEAMEIAKSLKTTLPDNPLVLNLTGTIYLAQGDSERGRSYLNEALSKDPAFLSAIQTLNSLDSADGDFDAIEKRLKAGLEADPKNEGMLLRYASFLDDRNRRRDAIALLERNRRGMLGSLALRKTLYRYYREANDLANMRKIAADMELIGTGGNLSFLVTAGQAYIEAKSYDKAVKVFEKLRELAPGDKAGAVGLVQSLALAKREDEAFSALSRLMEADTEDNLAASTLVRFFIQNKNYADALKTVDRIREDHPAQADLLTAQIYAAQGKTEETRDVLEKAVEQHPDAELMRSLFLHRMAAGETGEAVAQMSAWLEDNPDDSKGHTLMGSYLIGTKDYERAEKHLETALLSDPTNALVLNNLAWLRYELKRAGAIDLARRAHRLAPKSAEVKDTLGWLLAQTGADEEAAVILRQAADIAENDPQILYHLAVPLSRTGKTEEARKALKTALAMSGPFESREEAKALLQSLK